jgi:hypothetical protein
MKIKFLNQYRIGDQVFVPYEDEKNEFGDIYLVSRVINNWKILPLVITKLDGDILTGTIKSLVEVELNIKNDLIFKAWEEAWLYVKQENSGEKEEDTKSQSKKRVQEDLTAGIEQAMKVLHKVYGPLVQDAMDFYKSH